MLYLDNFEFIYRILENTLNFCGILTNEIGGQYVDIFGESHERFYYDSFMIDVGNLSDVLTR